jgi:DNA-binding NarL/FixJ family response regulator
LPLTIRENEVMAWLAKGFLDKEIAGQPGISFSAVRFHLHNIFQKLPAGNRTEAVIKAWDTIHR